MIFQWSARLNSPPRVGLGCRNAFSLPQRADEAVSLVACRPPTLSHPEVAEVGDGDAEACVL